VAVGAQAIAHFALNAVPVVRADYLAAARLTEHGNIGQGHELLLGF
jgi:hypothetical protein